MVSASASDSTRAAAAAADVTANDDTSRQDLDVDAFPLPRLPRAILFFHALQFLVVATAAGIVVGAWHVAGVGGALVAMLWPLLWLALLVVARVVGSIDETGMLRLEREAHPRFFALVDDVCARLGVKAPPAIFLINEGNAYNACVDNASSILLGFPAVMAYDLVALRSTLGHELGHHLAGDTDDRVQNAWRILQAFGLLPLGIFPFAPLARRFVRAAEADALRRCRLNEHAADFWGGVAAGRGTTAASLLKDRRGSHLWSTVLEDVAVLQEGGRRVTDIYAVLATARHHADTDGFEMVPSLEPTDPTSTHPAEVDRIAATEERLQALPTVTADDGHAIDLFEARDAIARDLTDLFYDPRGRGDGDWLLPVADDDLWHHYALALRPQLRGIFVATGHPRLAEPMSSTALFDEVRLLVEAGVRFVVDPTDPAVPGVLIPRDTLSNALPVESMDVTARITGLLLDLLVADQALRGTTNFGTVRVIAVGDADCFRMVLAARLAGGERWDDVADELDVIAARQQELIAWSRATFAPCMLHCPPAVVDGGPGAPWERDTEESLIPGRAAAAVADNSDRERSSSGEADAEEAPAAE